MSQIQTKKNVFLAPDAVILGDVTVEADCSVWYHATVRADTAPIKIGQGSNIQDNCVVHVDAGYPVEIGEYVTVGHSAILHGCTIKTGTMVGMGAILMNGSVVGKHCIIGAGALVTQNMKIPDGSLVVGSPAKVIRMLTEEEKEQNYKNAQMYIEEAKKYLEHTEG
ncbi:MAG: gamma carbonic anhydrase family protein [Lachnospiraceae bacterium]